MNLVHFGVVKSSQRLKKPKQLGLDSPVLKMADDQDNDELNPSGMQGNHSKFHIQTPFLICSGSSGCFPSAVTSSWMSN